jgi:hypothetical protein
LVVAVRPRRNFHLTASAIQHSIVARVERTNTEEGTSRHIQSGRSEILSANGSSNTRTDGRPPVGLANAVFPKKNRVNPEIVVEIIASRRRRFMLTILRSPERPYGLSVAVLAVIYPVKQGVKHKPVTEQANHK